MSNIVFDWIRLLLRTIDITVKSDVKFLVACLVTEISKDKDMPKR